jgi:acyl-CoA synthetase (AMP-forming)/AMP-acid ligase II
MEEKEYLNALEKLWDKNWPQDLPREIDYPFGEVPLTEYLRRWAQQTPEKPVVIFYGTEMTFEELDDLSDRFACFLAGRGLKKGDRVAVLMVNCPQFLIAFYGILKLGCIYVPVNPLFKEREFLYEMGDAEPRAIVALDLLFPLIQATRDRTTLETVVTTRLSDFIPSRPAIPVPDLAKMPPVDCPDTDDLVTVLKENGRDLPEVNISPDDVAALNYTGGTTGLPKGCVHTQRDMVYTAAAIWTFTVENASRDDVCLTYFPVFWIAGENVGLLLPVLAGGTEILLARWDPVAVLTAIDRYKATLACGLVDNIVELMEHPETGDFDLRSLRVTLGVSFVKKLNVEIRRGWEKLTGSKIYEAGFGMTETHTSDTFITGLQEGDRDLRSRPIFVGLPMPGTKLKICDFETGEPTPLGQEGEILIRTPSLFKGYWQKSGGPRDERRGEWFPTGDIGMIDEDGFLHYLGRKKEMLKVKGMSVFPSEVETLLGQHPAIDASGVLGRDDADKGQVPVAFVVLSPEFSGKISEEDLILWCRENMAGYKVPEIRIVPQLPMSATGKVLKEELKKELDATG